MILYPNLNYFQPINEESWSKLGNYSSTLLSKYSIQEKEWRNQKYLDWAHDAFELAQEYAYSEEIIENEPVP